MLTVALCSFIYP